MAAAASAARTHLTSIRWARRRHRGPLIGLHSMAGVASFAAGVVSLRLRAPGSWRFRVYLGSLAAMLAS